MLMHVLDHYNRRIHHCADGDRDSPQRHDIGVDALQLHDDERHENADREAQYDDRGGTQMKEKRSADQCDNQELLD